MVIERDAQFYSNQVRRIKKQMECVRSSNWNAEEKKQLQHIYAKMLRKNEKKLASFSNLRHN
ncbi:hypothetical protein E0K83_03765 [Gramella sp. BOM4]|nr:hypothetical protein [Christiangramia bathymodioli]